MKPEEIVVGGYYLKDNSWGDKVVLYVTNIENNEVSYKCMTMKGQMWSWPIVQKSLIEFANFVKYRVQHKKR